MKGTQRWEQIREGFLKEVTPELISEKKEMTSIHSRDNWKREDIEESSFEKDRIFRLQAECCRGKKHFFF